LKIIKSRKIIKLYILAFTITTAIFLLKSIYLSESEKSDTNVMHKVAEQSGTSISWWFFTVLITASITAFTTYNVQSRLAKNKLKLDRLEKRASFIQSIAKDLSELVNDRIYFVKVYIDGLASDGVSQETRGGYIKSVSAWNVKLHSVYSSLNMYDIVDLSNDIEREIHYKFVAIHDIFVGYVNDDSVNKGKIRKCDVDNLRDMVEDIVNSCSYLSKKISEISDESWNQTLEKIEPLTKDNLPFASNIVLIKRLFNIKGSPLGVNRSTYKH